MVCSSPNTWSTITPTRVSLISRNHIIWNIATFLLAQSFARTFYLPYIIGALVAAIFGHLSCPAFIRSCTALTLSRAGLILIGLSALILSVVEKLRLRDDGSPLMLLILASYVLVVGNIAGLGSTLVTIGAAASLFRTSRHILRISIYMAAAYCVGETSSRIYMFTSISRQVPRAVFIVAAGLLAWSYSLRELITTGSCNTSESVFTPTPPVPDPDDNMAGLSINLLSVTRHYKQENHSAEASCSMPSGCSPPTLRGNLSKSLTSEELTPPSFEQAPGDFVAPSFEAMGMVVPMSLLLLVESCSGRITLISPPYEAPFWDDDESIYYTLTTIFGARLLALILGGVLTRHVGPKQAAMLSCVWAAFICFGIALAFLSVTMSAGGQRLNIKTYPYACLVYDAFFAFSSTCMTIPMILIFAGLCHDRSERYKCGLVSRIVAGIYTVGGCGVILVEVPVVALLAIFTTIYIIVLHLLRTRTPRVRWLHYDMRERVRAPGIHHLACGVLNEVDGQIAATDSRSVGSRQGSSILANVERQTIANFV